MFTVPALPYEYDALEPAISADIMRLHHTKHHQAYVDKLNAAVASAPELEGRSIEDLLAHIDQLPEAISTAVRNNGGGHYNHSLFWQWMSPSGGGEPSGALIDAIVGTYGSFDTFVEKFTASATGLFGSGWVWLMPNMEIITTPNQDTPIMQGVSAPILGLDVWEHAYYLDYKSARPDYVTAWWNVVNWSFAQERFDQSK